MRTPTAFGGSSRGSENPVRRSRSSIGSMKTPASGFCLLDDRHAATRIGNDLPRHRTDQPAFEQRVTAVTHDDVVDFVSLGKTHDLLRGMSDRDMNMRFEGLLRVLRLNPAQHILKVAGRLFDDGLRF